MPDYVPDQVFSPRRLEMAVHCTHCSFVMKVRDLSHDGENFICPRCSSPTVEWVKHKGTSSIH